MRFYIKFTFLLLAVTHLPKRLTRKCTYCVSHSDEWKVCDWACTHTSHSCQPPCNQASQWLSEIALATLSWVWLEMVWSEMYSVPARIYSRETCSAFTNTSRPSGSIRVCVSMRKKQMHVNVWGHAIRLKSLLWSVCVCKSRNIDKRLEIIHSQWVSILEQCLCNPNSQIWSSYCVYVCLCGGHQRQNQSYCSMTQYCGRPVNMCSTEITLKLIQSQILMTKTITAAAKYLETPVTLNCECHCFWCKT